MSGRESLQNRLHVATVLLCLWLFATSPWVVMLRRMPREASPLVHAHVVVGLLALGVLLGYFVVATMCGRWRSLYPWLAGDLAAVRRDAVGLFRGRLPSPEGGGLLGTLEGALLLAALLVAATGAAWFVMQGTDVALGLRAAHIVGARVLLGLAIAHGTAVALHVFAFGA